MKVLKRFLPRDETLIDKYVGTFYAMDGESYLLNEFIEYLQELKNEAEKSNLSNIRVKIDINDHTVLGVRSFLLKLSGVGDQPPRDKTKLYE